MAQTSVGNASPTSKKTGMFDKQGHTSSPAYGQNPNSTAKGQAGAKPTDLNA